VVEEDAKVNLLDEDEEIELINELTKELNLISEKDRIDIFNSFVPSLEELINSLVMKDLTYRSYLTQILKQNDPSTFESLKQ